MSSSDTIDYNKLYSLAESCNTGEFISNLTGQLGKQGFDINKQIHGSGRTLLHITAKNGCTEIVNALLEDKRIDIDAKDNNGYTPLHFAAESGNTNIVNALLKKGASVHEEDNSGIMRN